MHMNIELLTGLLETSGWVEERGKNPDYVALILQSDSEVDHKLLGTTNPKVGM